MQQKSTVSMSTGHNCNKIDWGGEEDNPLYHFFLHFPISLFSIDISIANLEGFFFFFLFCLVYSVCLRKSFLLLSLPNTCPFTSPPCFGDDVLSFQKYINYIMSCVL